MTSHGYVLKFTSYVIGSTLLRKMKDAGSDMAKYVQQHQDLESSLPSDVLVKWGLQVEAWEADPSLLNPFEQVIISKSRSSILN